MPECTSCGIDLEGYDNVEDVAVDYAEVIVYKTCSCPLCNKHFEWEETYKFSEYRNFKES